MESRIDRRLLEHDKRLDDLTDKVDFFIRTSLPPKEGVSGTRMHGACIPTVLRFFDGPSGYNKSLRGRLYCGEDEL